MVLLNLEIQYEFPPSPHTAYCIPLTIKGTAKRLPNLFLISKTLLHIPHTKKSNVEIQYEFPPSLHTAYCIPLTIKCRCI